MKLEQLEEIVKNFPWYDQDNNDLLKIAKEAYNLGIQNSIDNCIENCEWNIDELESLKIKE